jgi:hypothetical protein
LVRTGSPELGRKILQTAPGPGFGAEQMNTGMGLVIAQLGLYTFMIGVIVTQSIASGLYVYLVPGFAAVAVGAMMIWLIERGRMKLKREGSEARRYLEALGRISQGAAASQVFAPDGTLVSRPTA